MTPEEANARLKRLLDGARAGCEAAASELIEVYGRAIRRVVRHHLADRLRGLFDSVDFVQEVWADFFVRAIRDHQFDTPARLVAFLAAMAERKVRAAYRDHTREKRDVRRQCRLDSPAVSPDRDFLTRDPGPERLAMSREEVERLFRDSPEVWREGLCLLVEGGSLGEAAEKMRVPVRCVRRLLENHRRNRAGRDRLSRFSHAPPCGTT